LNRTVQPPHWQFSHSDLDPAGLMRRILEVPLTNILSGLRFLWRTPRECKA
jgi:hypothetical protein